MITPMNKSLCVFVVLILASAGLAGCLGNEDDLDLSAPIAAFSVTPVEGEENTFRFDASASKGSIVEYQWTFGDNDPEQPNQGEVIDHTYKFGDGTYTVLLVVFDADGVDGIETQNVVVGTGLNEAPEALFDLRWRLFDINEPVLVDASESADADDDPILYVWDFNFFMNGNQYLEFRAAKDDAQPAGADDTVAAGGSGDGDGDGGKDWTGLPGASDLLALTGSSADSPGHGAGPGDISSTSQVKLERQSEAPIYNLEEGFPEAGTYFIRLITVDAKGASDPVWSEEIFPVNVVDAKESRFISDSATGTFKLGTTEAVNKETPDSDEAGYADSRIHTFNIPRDPLAMHINLTWNSLGDGVPPTSDNALVMYIKTATNQDRGPINADETDADEDGVTTESGVYFIYEDNTGLGEYTVTIIATRGAEIAYTLSWWAELDFDEFRELEKDYR